MIHFKTIRKFLVIAALAVAPHLGKAPSQPGAL